LNFDVNGGKLRQSHFVTTESSFHTG
jgi:hypothetical protein